MIIIINTIIIILNKVACGFIAGFLHYFFLASFLWMLLEGVHIVLMLVQVFDASRSRLPYYYATAYGACTSSAMQAQSHALSLSHTRTLSLSSRERAR